MPRSYEHELLPNISLVHKYSIDYLYLILFIDQSKFYLSKEMINIIWVLIQELEKNNISTAFTRTSNLFFEIMS